MQKVLNKQKKAIQSRQSFVAHTPEEILVEECTFEEQIDFMKFADPRTEKEEIIDTHIATYKARKSKETTGFLKVFPKYLDFFELVRYF